MWAVTPLRTSRSVLGHRPCVCERAGTGHDTDRAARVQRLHDPPPKFTLIRVDNHNWQLAQDLGEIRLWVIDAVDQRRADEQDECAPDRQHTLPFAREGAGDAGPIGGEHHLLRRRPTAQASRDRPQPQECQQPVKCGECRERGKRAGGI
jgi:hypothetical protein